MLINNSVVGVYDERSHIKVTYQGLKAVQKNKKFEINS